MALTAAQQAQVAAFFAQNVYGALSQTATMATDTLATAIGQMDAAVAVSVSAGSASIAAAGSATGTFTVQQAEILLAYVLLKRAGVI